jgi:putative iron-dependent peroxidase
MFIGRPPGNYDRLLDFSRAITGSLFFAPSMTFLENLGEAPSSEAASQGTSEQRRRNDGSLGIGSLKAEISHE